VSARSVRFGAWGAVGLATFYALVVGLASGSADHLADQARQDWYLLVPIIVGFGVQVGLMAELRRRHRLHRAAMAAGGTGTAGSVAGMVACCAHHLADLAPFLGASGAATFLYDRRLAFMVGGLIVNALGVAVSVRKLRDVPVASHEHEEVMECVASWSS
jgi:hypothetical protein